MQAEARGVRVIGMSVGPNEPTIGSYFREWGACLTPEKFPELLKALAADSHAAYRRALQAPERVLIDPFEDFEQARASHSSTIDAMTKHMETIKTIDVAVGGAKVELLFLLDVSSSMSPFGKAAKAAMYSVVNAVANADKKKGEGRLDVPVRVRVAVLPFRDGQVLSPLLDFWDGRGARDEQNNAVLSRLHHLEF